MRPKHAALWVVRVLFSDELASEHWNSQGPNKQALQTFNQLPTPRPRTTHQYQTTTNDLAFVPLSTNMHSNIQKHAFMLVLVHASHHATVHYMLFLQICTGTCIEEMVSSSLALLDHCCDPAKAEQEPAAQDWYPESPGCRNSFITGGS